MLEMRVFWLVSMIGDFAGIEEGGAEKARCSTMCWTVYSGQTGLSHV